MRRGFVTGSVLVFLCLTVAACSASEDAESAQTEGDSLQDYIPGLAAFNAEGAEEQFRKQELEAQEQIAVCMANQGFEYVPYVANTEDIFYGDAETPEEFAKLYGLGVTWDLLNTPEFDENEPPPELADDPNYAITEAMAPEEQEAYYQALHGEEPDIDFETMTEEEIDAFFENWEPGGCYNEAYQTFGNADASQAFYEQFGDQLNDMYERAQADPRIAELESNWAECMSEGGYDFKDEHEATIYIARRLEEVGAISDLEVDAGGGGWGYSSEGMPPGSDAYKAAEGIFEEEVEIAVASVACQGDVEQVYQEVFAEYEQEFIEANRGALEQFRDSN